MATLDPSTRAGARALERLETALIGWMTTINPDGQPQSSPLWFLWAGGEILVYSHKRAPRNDSIADRPLVSFNLNTDAHGDDVLTMEGTARIDAGAPTASENEPYLAKYRGMLDSYGWTPDYFSGEYPVPIRIEPTRWRVG
jgi:PPOX class probable F420-dependent enzyme